MLPAPYLELVARDPAIAGIRTLLDHYSLGRLFGAGPLRAEMVRYKPAESFLVGGSFGYAKAYAPDLEEKSIKRADAVFAEERIAIFRFPNDKELRLSKRDGALRQLELEGFPWETLRYNPERRYVGKAGPCVFKFYTDDDFEPALSKHSIFADARGFQVPSLIGKSSSARWMATRFLDGERPQAPLQARGIGQALRSLHLTACQPLSPVNYVGNLEGGIAWLLPRLAEKTMRLKACLPKPQSCCVVHGDFHAGQVLLAGSNTILLDFDSAGAGEPTFDLGNFLAHQICNGCEDISDWKEALLSGYGSKIDEQRLQSMIALGLFRLAMEPFRRNAENWDLEVERRVDLALSCLPEPFYVRALHAVARMPEVRKSELLRHKPGKRALIEAVRADGSAFLVKVQAKRGSLAGMHVQKNFFDAGFRPPSLFCVPEPVGELPGVDGWAQVKVGGRTAEEVFASGNDLAAATMIGAAAAALQVAGVPTNKTHRLADELRILRERLSDFVQFKPLEKKRVARLLEVVADIGSKAPAADEGPQHRDFYAANLIIEGARVWILDLDLYCQAELGLDVGNFMAHLADQAFRKYGNFDALVSAEQAVAEAYTAASHMALMPRIQLYRALSLARLAAISVRFNERRDGAVASLEYAIHECEKVARCIGS